MADSFKIPWFIFSDGDTDATASVNRALTAIGQRVIPNDNVIALAAGMDFEAELSMNGSKDLLMNEIIKQESKSPQHEADLQRTWAGKTEPEQRASILDTLRANKTQYGSRVGKALPVPVVLEALFKKIDTALAVTTRKANVA